MSTYPQKIKVSENNICATLPAVSAVSIPATTICVNVDVNIRKTQTNKNISAPRSCTCPSGMAFLYMPIGWYQQKKMITAINVFHGSSTTTLDVTKTI